METWDAIRARRNVRQYADQPIARENLERIVEAGRRAPSSRDWQPWNFVVVTDREQLIELAKVWDRGGRHIAQSAATIALVAKEPEDERHRDWLMYDFGQATENMMLAAARPRHRYCPFGGHRPRAGAAVLGFPDGYLAVYLIGLGYPADRPLRPITRPIRRPFDRGRALEPLVAHAYGPPAAGAAAALRAATEPGTGIAAVVPRGGRPDLARPRLAAVTAPTLLIVGGHDDVVLDLNRPAQRSYGG